MVITILTSSKQKVSSQLVAPGPKDYISIYLSLAQKGLLRLPLHLVIEDSHN